MSVTTVRRARRRRPPCRRALSEHELVLAAQRGDPAARAQLIETFVPLIASVARTYRGSATIDRRELMQEGVAGLLNALGRYDPARGTPFWSYAAWWVRQGMQQVVAELTQPVVLSDRALRQLARVRAARRAHAGEHGAWPTTAELAGETGLPCAQVEHLLAVERPPRGLEEPQGGREAPVRSHSEMLADPRAEDEFERVLTRIENDRVLHLLSRLDERPRAILRARYGLDGPEQTLREIARGLGVSAERVRQLEQQALDELRAAANGA